MFTTNQVVAAPITVGRRHTASTGGRVKAVLVNAGNANCASGEAGIRACNDTCRAAAIYSLLGSASLNAIDPEIYLQDVLERVADHPINKITELPHWNMPVATQKTPSSIR